MEKLNTAKELEEMKIKKEIPAILETLDINAPSLVKQDVWERKLKDSLEKDNETTKELLDILPKKKDGNQSYGELNADGAVTISIAGMSVEDYYKAYPWNKPGLGDDEREKMFQSAEHKASGTEGHRPQDYAELKAPVDNKDALMLLTNLLEKEPQITNDSKKDNQPGKAENDALPKNQPG